jgi:hypothetical protein
MYAPSTMPQGLHGPQPEDCRGIIDGDHVTHKNASAEHDANYTGVSAVQIPDGWPLGIGDTINGKDRGVPGRAAEYPQPRCF